MLPYFYHILHASPLASQADATMARAHGELQHHNAARPDIKLVSGNDLLAESLRASRSAARHLRVGNDGKLTEEGDEALPGADLRHLAALRAVLPRGFGGVS